MSDNELERLKARRLQEMRRNMMNRAEKTDTPIQPEPPRAVLVRHLGYRGEEVLRAAERQFPRETPLITSQLAEMIRAGEISKLDGGALMTVFRSVGIRVKVNTSIKVDKDGKFVDLSERLGK